MDKGLHLPIILQLAAVGVIIAEIIIPSGGILAILAAGLFGYSLYTVFAHVSAEAGMAFVAADIIMIPILVYIGIKFMARSPVTLRTMLSRESGVTSQPEALSDYLGCMGRAATDLRPSGVAVIDKTRVDVVTRGEYIQKNTQIEVIAVRGNAIIVRTKEANA